MLKSYLAALDRNALRVAAVSSSRKRSWCCGWDIILQLYMPIDSKEERYDSCSATEEEDGWHACYGQTGQLVKELEMP